MVCVNNLKHIFEELMTQLSSLGKITRSLEVFINEENRFSNTIESFSICDYEESTGDINDLDDEDKYSYLSSSYETNNYSKKRKFSELYDCFNSFEDQVKKKIKF